MEGIKEDLKTRGYSFVELSPVLVDEIIVCEDREISFRKRFLIWDFSTIDLPVTELQNLEIVNLLDYPIQHPTSQTNLYQYFHH